jgi:hypothetical protein
MLYYYIVLSPGHPSISILHANSTLYYLRGSVDEASILYIAMCISACTRSPCPCKAVRWDTTAPAPAAHHHKILADECTLPHLQIEHTA